MKTYEDIILDIKSMDVPISQIYIAQEVRNRLKQVRGGDFERLCNLIYKVKANHDLSIDKMVDFCADYCEKYGNTSSITEQMLLEA